MPWYFREYTSLASDLERVDGLARPDVTLDETIGGQLPCSLGEFGIGLFGVNRELDRLDGDRKVDPANCSTRR